MDMAEKKDEYLEAFKSLGERPNIPLQVEEVLETPVICMAKEVQSLLIWQDLTYIT